ncbi:hypothetical protein GWI33_008063 [Rhynchophorus ferrugineus]|uniref:Uncharacterized protein n=1 Tax=Rhynchophorus ferrugineus TaxID=354439 RepID=A0A834IDF9_RHYFE|nr:hypothetical protein GWI33_008063 [Rhynchophorus ferrugineus]
MLKITLRNILTKLKGEAFPIRLILSFFVANQASARRHCPENSRTAPRSNTFPPDRSTSVSRLHYLPVCRRHSRLAFTISAPRSSRSPKKHDPEPPRPAPLRPPRHGRFKIGFGAASTARPNSDRG